MSHYTSTIEDRSGGPTHGLSLASGAGHAATLTVGGGAHSWRAKGACGLGYYPPPLTNLHPPALKGAGSAGDQPFSFTPGGRCTRPGSPGSQYCPHYPPTPSSPFPRFFVPADYASAPPCRPKKRPSIFNREGLTCAAPKYVDTTTGEIVRCEKCTCTYCLLVDAGRIVGAIRLSATTHSFGLSLLGETATEIQESVRRWLQCLRRITGLDVQICWAAETGPRGTNPHVHGFLWASGSIEEADVAAAVARSHIGREFHFKYEDGEYDAEYLAYIFKALAEDQLRGLFLDLNRSGKRTTIHHATNDFFRNGADGEKLSLRDAKKEAYRQHRPSGRGRQYNPDVITTNVSTAVPEVHTPSMGEHRPSDLHPGTPPPMADNSAVTGNTEEEGPLDVGEFDLIAELTFVDGSNRDEVVVPPRASDLHLLARCDDLTRFPPPPLTPCTGSLATGVSGREPQANL